MDVVFLHQTIATHDAIGNDICCMHRLLKEHGHNVYVFCEYLLTDQFESISRPTLDRLCRSRDCLLIYHHSNYWQEGEEILDNASAKIIIRYHNITPEWFFKRYDLLSAEKCKSGRDQTLRLAEKYRQAWWLSDSFFNLRESNLTEQVQHRILPPFSGIDALRANPPSEAILKSLLLNQAINLLFVGRIAPNKNYEFLFKVIHDYKHRYKKNIKLHLVGKRDMALHRYYEMLGRIIEQAGLHENICWVGEIDDTVISSYFLGCDLFLSSSLHEGFFVPILEAQCFSLPIIARKSSVIPETMADGGLCLGEHVQLYSAAIDLLAHNDRFKNELIERGQRNCRKRFDQKKNADAFCTFVEEVAVQ